MAEDVEIDSSCFFDKRMHGLPPPWSFERNFSSLRLLNRTMLTNNGYKGRTIKLCICHGSDRGAVRGDWGLQV